MDARDTPPPPPVVRQPVPTWRLLALLLWVCAVPTVLALTLAWLPRFAWMDSASIVAESRIESFVFVAVFLARTFTFHAGVALLVAAALSLLIRRRKFATACIVCGLLEVAGSDHRPIVVDVEW